MNALADHSIDEAHFCTECCQSTLRYHWTRQALAHAREALKGAIQLFHLSLDERPPIMVSKDMSPDARKIANATSEAIRSQAIVLAIEGLEALLHADRMRESALLAPIACARARAFGVAKK